MAQVHVYDERLFAFAALKYDAVCVCVQFFIFAVGKHVQRAADLGQLAVMRQDVRIHVVPGERHAAERVGIAFHADLVAVIDARHAENGKQQHGGRFQALYGEFSRFGVHLGAAHLIFIIGADAAQSGQNARRIVRSQNIHQQVKHEFRIIVAQHRHGLAENRRIAAGDELDDGVFQRIIHHAVQLFPLKIFSALAVRDLVGSVFPHFAEDDGVGVRRLDGIPDLDDKFVRQFVGDV